MIIVSKHGSFLVVYCPLCALAERSCQLMARGGDGHSSDGNTWPSGGRGLSDPSQPQNRIGGANSL